MRAPTVTPQLQRLAAQAARDPARGLTTVASLSDADFLRAAYRRTSQASAAGLDGGTAQRDAARLEENLRDLHERLRRGVDQAAPVERVWIAKDDGGRRPIGQPACEDKRVQRAGAMLVEALYAQDFSDCSYGCRQGRSPHEALHARRQGCRSEGSGWIVEADGRGDVASIDRTRLREGRRQRVNEGRVVRRIGQGLRAGGLEAGVLTHPETGVVQGGGLSPLLAHICLPHVLAAGCEQEVRPRMQGSCLLIRFADDFVIGGALEGEPRRSMAVLPKRCARLGLRMHPTKPALIACRKPEAHHGSAPGNGPFDFLELPQDWARSRRGLWGIKRRTARKRLCRTQKALWRWCHLKRHAPLPYQYPQRCPKFRGHFQSFGLRGNCRLREAVRRYAEKAWRSWLRRRSSKSPIAWAKFQQQLATYGLPTPKIVHNS